MVGTVGRCRRPGVGAQRAAQGAFGTVELCSHFNGNAGPRPALEGSSWPTSPRVSHINVFVSLSSRGSRRKTQRCSQTRSHFDHQKVNHICGWKTTYEVAGRLATRAVCVLMFE